MEPLVPIFRGAALLHGPTHTLIGAIVIGVIATILGKPIGQHFLRVIKQPDACITWTASLSGAFLGTLSHILLDGIMHADMSPWLPIAHTNNILGLFTVSELHYLCYGLGIIGVVVLILKYYLATLRV